MIFVLLDRGLPCHYDHFGALADGRGHGRLCDHPSDTCHVRDLLHDRACSCALFDGFGHGHLCDLERAHVHGHGGLCDCDYHAPCHRGILNVRSHKGKVLLVDGYARGRLHDHN